MPYLTATSLVGSSWRPTSDTTSTPSMFSMPSRCLMPNAPAPASATLMVLTMSVVLQDEVADGGVARRHVIKAVPHGGLLAAVDVPHGAARDQPHHKFDAFAAGLPHIVDMRNGRESFGIGDKAFQERLIELLVDQPGAWP